MGKSSKDKRDIYYRMAKVEGFRARSAYKLSQIFEETGIMCKYDDNTIRHFLLANCCEICSAAHEISSLQQPHMAHTPELYTKIVDLCSAPGSWSQLVSEIVLEQHKQLLDIAKSLTRCNNSFCVNLQKYLDKPIVISVDLQEMAPLPNVHFIRGDITDQCVLQQVFNYFNTRSNVDNNNNSVSVSTDENMKADIVLCDGAPDVSGLHEVDGFIQSELIRFSLHMATQVLRLGGTYISKMFRTEKYPFIISRIGFLFDKVQVMKPSASRNSSVEAFIVAQGFKGNIENLSQMLATPLVNPSQFEFRSQLNAALVPFISCGDLSSFDSDRNYPLDDYQPLDPVQPPITAPYIKP
ncbi:rlmE, rrmJ, ftsJ, ribosomal RNA large subunit methyltransferase E [Babesia microti strain RI]|uniref:Putative tRNA (cytidine(32)/guanosine(34)-2'-O)-methyltransferase n=1 Tax=Babesia microti (strain RI) TaxID=1133968 RepID=A0A0K3ANW0_BABMR|nr:rlmE, rrmJ, ftsJ, ribosomal RNA large subunit methyltransferase E [Babesia microti strain RI]CTQ41394.1 rlmE, rrmJ, ftsJ, ribosomal RNA large subunit methyltransferase E [Babesia microti strain RI]|eukprot:XP_012649405.1 rlmE, rrmJ, ftsJ, ribosomal RNA large subunit methyltransferase E [Babesia microti strain RI]